ncbi:S-layer homology domain-containing protein [Sporomusa sphaeroides]|uniref:S-layer homology domain-containing protein n=1 Tax=Sporomusa sphaeroides TaxID=47679 RepID=UPI003DA0BEDD
MKRQTAMALAAVFAMSVAGTALAAPANPFVDVPAKHWSYDAVSKLAQAGVVSGYGDGTYKGDRTMTRYEMATIIAKAMANSEKADAETQKTIDALAAEYGAELNNLGVRVDNLEKKVGNVKFDGNIRLRYDNADKDIDRKAGDTTFKARARLAAKAAINDEWNAVMRFETTEDMRDSGMGAENDTKLDLLYVTGPAFGTKATIGRFDVAPIYGTVIDSFVDGVKVEFGNKLKTTLMYGKEDNKVADDFFTPVKNIDTTLTAAVLGYATSKATNLNAAYYNVEADFATGTEDLNIWEFGFDSKVAKNLVLKASYAKSDMDYFAGEDKQDTAYQAGLWFKGAKLQDKGSHGIWAQYRSIEDDATIDTTWASATGYKGLEVGFDYTLQKNMKLTSLYFDGEKTNNSDPKNDKKFYRAQVEFFF